jgi:hypothetical protein
MYLQSRTQRSNLDIAARLAEGPREQSPDRVMAAADVLTASAMLMAGA